jgi:hypothetical protein
VKTVAEATKALARGKQAREDNPLTVVGRKPTFNEFVATYLSRLEDTRTTKRPETVRKERHVLDGWKAHLGGVS